MFDPKKWINSAPKIEDETIELFGEKIKIRRLAGLQWEQYLKSQQNFSQSATALLLHYGVVNEEDSGTFPLQDMEAFYDACPAKADKIASRILDITIKAIAAEEKAVKDAEKNFEKTDTQRAKSAGVGISDTSGQQNQHATN